MAGEIEEPFRLNFQADLLHSGSISFGRFESESLSWERRSIFSHNRYLEEVEKYSKPGTVTEKKAYFEAHFRRKALLKQNSSECQDEEEFPTSRNNDLHDLEESGNGNEDGQYTYYGESPCSSGPCEYNKETEIEQHEKGDVEELYAENGHGSRHVACFDEIPYNSGYDEDSITLECETQNCELLSAATQDEPIINIVDFSASVLEHVKIDEIHQNETEKVMVNSEESIGVTLIDEVILVDVALKANDLSLTCQTPKKDDDTSAGPRRMLSSKVKPASEKKLTRATLNTQAYIDRFQKDSNEASKGSMKPKTSESKGLLVRKTEKKSPRPASSFTCSGVKTSKAEDAITSLKEKELRHKKSMVKDLRSEKAVKARSSLSYKSLPGVRSTVNRPKQAISSSKVHISQSTAGFSFKTDQRAENRKEFYMRIAGKMQAKEVEINQVEAKTLEKQAAEMKQFRRSLNFKAKPMPSFYNESAGGSDEHKVTAISTTANQPRPRSHSVGDKNALKSCVPSDTRPSSSTSSTNRSPEKKKKDTRLTKHKETEPRARHMATRKHKNDIHMGSGSKSGRLAVGVAS